MTSCEGGATAGCVLRLATGAGCRPTVWVRVFTATSGQPHPLRFAPGLVLSPAAGSVAHGPDTRRPGAGRLPRAVVETSALFYSLLLTSHVLVPGSA